jgi:hypothetical protein
MKIDRYHPSVILAWDEICPLENFQKVDTQAVYWRVYWRVARYGSEAYRSKGLSYVIGKV